MSHSYVKIWVHAIIGVKYRDPLITSRNELLTYRIISRELKKVNCKLVAINGTENHIHILFLLNKKVSISKVMQQVKGASSRMISRLGICGDDFAWQIGYGAFSVSDKDVKGVQRYIYNQKVHHQKITYKQEVRNLNKTV